MWGRNPTLVASAKLDSRVNLTSQKDNLVRCRNVELSIPESHIWSVQNRRGSRRCRLSRWDVRARARRWGGSRYSRTLCAQRVRGGAHSSRHARAYVACRRVTLSVTDTVRGRPNSVTVTVTLTVLSKKNAPRRLVFAKSNIAWFWSHFASSPRTTPMDD